MNLYNESLRRALHAPMVRHKALLEKASDDILRERHGIGIADAEQALRHLKGERAGHSIGALDARLPPRLGVSHAPTVIDEAMATAVIGANADEENANTECIRVQEELTLTQMVEEGLDDAEEGKDDDPVV